MTVLGLLQFGKQVSCLRSSLEIRTDPQSHRADLLINPVVSYLDFGASSALKRHSLY